MTEQHAEEGAGKGGKKVRQRPHGIARKKRVIGLIDKHRASGTLERVPFRLGERNVRHHASLLMAHGVTIPDYAAM